MDTYTLEDAVANGVEFLNNSGPAEWWDRVDYDRLDPQDGSECVLGQVFSADAAVTGYYSGYDLIAEQMNAAWLHSRGFLGMDEEEVNELREEWINAIENIRVEVNA